MDVVDVEEDSVPKGESDVGRYSELVWLTVIVEDSLDDLGWELVCSMVGKILTSLARCNLLTPRP